MSGEFDVSALVETIENSGVVDLYESDADLSPMTLLDLYNITRKIQNSGVI